jgi:hypothetical protein
MGLERLTPTLLSVGKQRLRALLGLLRHVSDHPIQSGHRVLGSNKRRLRTRFTTNIGYLANLG